jgi:transposase-like protein
MYYTSPPCPFCQQTQPIVYWGTNESKTRRFRCKDCNKTFTTQPKSNRITPEKEALISKLLEERLSIEAIARATNAAKRTVYNVLKKTKSVSQTNQTNPSLPTVPPISP